MNAQQNRRYRKAATDYMHLPLDHPAVVRLAWDAAQAADLAAFEVLRHGAERSADHALPRHLAHL